MAHYRSGIFSKSMESLRFNHEVNLKTQNVEVTPGDKDSDSSTDYDDNEVGGIRGKAIIVPLGRNNLLRLEKAKYGSDIDVIQRKRNKRLVQIAKEGVDDVSATTSEDASLCDTVDGDEAKLDVVNNIEKKDTDLSLTGLTYNVDGNINEKLEMAVKRAGLLPELFVWPFQMQLYVFLEIPCTRVSIAFSFISMAFIALSTLTVVLETWPDWYSEKPKSIWFILEATCVAFFTIEFISRWYACLSWWRFLMVPLNIIDILSFLPFYVELILEDTGVIDFRFIRLIRLVRIIRVFKITRYSPGLQLTLRALSKSKDALVLLIFYLIIAIVLFSCLIYFAERGTWIPHKKLWILDDGRPSQFQSVPDSFWWCLSTITTTGYGDAVPETPIGKSIAAFTMLAGVMIIAFPTSILGTNFMSEWQAKQREDIRKKYSLVRTKKKSRTRRISKSEQLIDLKIENETLLESVTFIQELLQEINPTAVTSKIHKMRHQLRASRMRIDELERIVAVYRKREINVNSNLEHKRAYSVDSNLNRPTKSKLRLFRRYSQAPSKSISVEPTSTKVCSDDVTLCTTSEQIQVHKLASELRTHSEPCSASVDDNTIDTHQSGELPFDLDQKPDSVSEKRRGRWSPDKLFTPTTTRTSLSDSNLWSDVIHEDMLKAVPRPLKVIPADSLSIDRVVHSNSFRGSITKSESISGGRYDVGAPRRRNTSLGSASVIAIGKTDVNSTESFATNKDDSLLVQMKKYCSNTNGDHSMVNGNDKSSIPPGVSKEPELILFEEKEQTVNESNSIELVEITV